MSQLNAWKNYDTPMAARIIIFSKWRRFFTSRPPDQKSQFFAPRDGYLIMPMSPTTTVKIRVAFCYVGRKKYFKVDEISADSPKLQSYF